MRLNPGAARTRGAGPGPLPQPRAASSSARRVASLAPAVLRDRRRKGGSAAPELVARAQKGLTSAGLGVDFEQDNTSGLEVLWSGARASVLTLPEDTQFRHPRRSEGCARARS